MEEDIQNYSSTVMFRGTPCLCPTTENKRFLSPPLMDKREGVRGMFRGTGGKEGMLHSIELNLTYQI